MNVPTRPHHAPETTVGGIRHEEAPLERCHGLLAELEATFARVRVASEHQRQPVLAACHSLRAHLAGVQLKDAA